MTFDDVAAMLNTLPPDPIAPEIRGLARLRPTPFVHRGQVYRVLLASGRPLILIHPDDVAELRDLYVRIPYWTREQLEQDIADCCEQVFAELEARGE